MRVLDASVVAALREMVRRGLVTAGVARAAARRAGGMRARQYPFEPFLDRVWELRDSVTTYDAWYIALAESLDVPLVTADTRLRQAADPRCPVLSPRQALESSA